MKMELLFNISDIAIVTGDNQYKTKRDYLIDFWKKNAKSDYEKYVNNLNYVKETDQDIINKITNSNNIDIKKDLYKCMNSKDTTVLNNVKKTILTKMDGLNEDIKKEITKSINNLTNTRFGIKNENDVTKLYESMTGNTIIKDNKYHKSMIYQTDIFSIFIGGKIDGFNNDDGSVIEIKNRVNKLFYNLRNYEKVQIMCYLYLFNSKKGHLVEAFKKDNNTLINIIEVVYDESYINYIIDCLVKFSIFFVNFMNDNELKIKLIKNEDFVII